MGLFGLKNKKSSQSDSSSIRKHTLHASTASSTAKHNPEASDIVGDSPSHGSTPPSNQPRRQGSIASESASLHTRNSGNMMKLFSGSTSKRRSSKGPVDSQSPKITQPSEYFNGRNSTSQNRSSAGNTPAIDYAKTSSSPAVETPGSLPPIATPTGDGSLVDAVNRDVPGAGLNATSSPRPSDLFAGKGVQWNEIDLTARDPTPLTQPAKAEDLQSFLKARRQWIPTFRTEDSVAEEEGLSTERLANLSFNTTAVEKTGGLMSLKDLEESHKRKAALSGQLPIVSSPAGAVFSEAGGSRASMSADLPPRPTAPARNQSFRTSHFISHSIAGTSSFAHGNGNGNGLTKSGVGSLSRKPVPNAHDERDSKESAAQRSIPQRRSSMQKSRSSSNGNGTDHPPATGAADARESMETATPGFATPETSEGAVQGKLTENAGTGAVAIPASGSTGAAEAPPRPPKADRTPTASRKNSQDPLHASIAPREPTAASNGTAETPKAAPALQNQVPAAGVAAYYQ